jgi:hypothetical protein
LASGIAKLSIKAVAEFWGQGAPALGIEVIDSRSTNGVAKGDLEGVV